MQAENTLRTNEVGSKPSITEPSSGPAIEEVLPIRKKIALQGGCKTVVVSRIDTRISENQNETHIFFSCQFSGMNNVQSLGELQQW